MNNEIWLPIEDVCTLTGEIKETVRRKCKSEVYVSKFTKNGKFKNYSVLLSSLSRKAQNKYFHIEEKKNLSIKEINENMSIYSTAPEWAKKQADKYLELLTLTDGMSHGEIEEFLKVWNVKYPNKSCCYTSIYNARIKYEKYGVAGLLSQKGQNSCRSSIPDDYFEYYKSLYLREGAPSAFFCWQVTLGFAKDKDNIDVTKFPSYKTFDRYLKSKVPEQAIYLARYGNAAWNKKYASYISRDYSTLKAGECWVSDHAQIDVAVNFNGTVCFPWVTVFRDVKTSKWLGWFLHADSPNSDHIFQAFYYGVIRFGIPEDIYLDNGKDYRCKDFAGGRDKNIKIKHSSQKENSLMKNIGVNVHFALPYNAQTKPVERDFLKIKTFLSKGFVGYRGGKITERPEKLKDEIKLDKIMSFENFKTLFDDFIENYLNKKSSNGKVLNGKCPDELWSEEFTNKKVISKDALRLFCMRTSKNMTIGRNGIYDSQLQITYWNEWMICEKGRKVFIRRDIQAYQEAWVFDAETEEYLGKANTNHTVSFLAKTNIERAKYKKAIEQKNKEKKILKSYIKCKYSPSNEEIVANLKIGLGNTNFDSNPKISEIKNTKMDQVVNIEKQSEKKTQYKYVAQVKPKATLYLTESQKKRALAKKVI
jgi:hypothetical protein